MSKNVPRSSPPTRPSASENRRSIKRSLRRFCTWERASSRSFSTLRTRRRLASLSWRSRSPTWRSNSSRLRSASCRRAYSSGLISEKRDSWARALRSSFSSWLLRRRSARRGSALLGAAAGGSSLSLGLESCGRERSRVSSPSAASRATSAAPSLSSRSESAAGGAEPAGPWLGCCCCWR